MSDIEKNIRAKVQAFVEELSELVRQAALERVSEALGTGAPAPSGRGRRAPASEKKAAKRAKGQKRAPAEMERLLKTIASTIASQPGIRADQLAQEIGISTRDTSLPIKKLLADKVIAKKGQKRATQYFPGKNRG